MNSRADALSRQPDVTDNIPQESRPLLKLAALEACKPVWADDLIIARVKVVARTDPTLQPVLAYFENGADKALADVCREF